MKRDSDPPSDVRADLVSSVSRLPVAYQHLPDLAPRERLRERLHGPLFHAYFAVFVATVSGTVSLLAHERGRVAVAAIALVLVAGSLVMLALVVAQAAWREKVIEYWTDRRDLRVDLWRLRAERRLLVATVERLHAWDRQLQPEPQPALAALIDDAHTALAAYLDDVAVLLVTECDGRWTISHIAQNSGGRWSYLHAEKWCAIGTQTAEERLASLAPYPIAFPAPIPGGRLLLAVLCEEPMEVWFGDGEDGDPRTGHRTDPLTDLRLCFEVLAAHWSRQPPLQAESLRSVG